MKIPELITCSEAARRLGVSPQQISKWVAAGRIPKIMVGGRPYIEPRHARKKPAVLPPGRKPAGDRKPAKKSRKKSG